MLLAEGSVDNAALGSWMQIAFFILGTICAVVVATVHVLQAMRKDSPKPDSEYVTRGELIQVINRVDMDLKEIRTYTQSRMHDMANKLHAINIRIVWIMGVLAQLAGKTEGVTIPAEPMISTPDEA